jgi:hypothetical protein
MQGTGVEGELVGDLMQGSAEELECGELIWVENENKIEEAFWLN